jgi:hypothetical protein
MPTSKPKISGYVPQHLFDSFMSLKDSQRYESASQTLIAILSEYFGVEQQVDHQSRPLVLRFPSIEDFEALQRKVDLVAEKLELLVEGSNPLSKPPSESMQNADVTADSGEPASDPLSRAHDESDSNLSLDLGISQEELGMIQQDLAPRLNMGISTLSAKKKLPTDKLIEYTRAKDPDGIGWTYSKEDKRFYPERSLPSNPNSGSPS